MSTFFQLTTTQRMRVYATMNTLMDLVLQKPTTFSASVYFGNPFLHFHRQANISSSINFSSICYIILFFINFLKYCFLIHILLCFRTSWCFSLQTIKKIQRKMYGLETVMYGLRFLYVSALSCEIK